MKTRHVCRFAAACASFFLLAPFAHSANRPIPDDVKVKVFARTEQNRLEVLVRVPLAAVKDIQFPVRGDTGYLDLGAAKSMLPGAARYWVADCFDVYDDGVRIPRPEISDTRISATFEPSFDSYDDALAHFRAPDLPGDSNVFWDQVWLDIRFEYPLRSSHSLVAIRPKVAGLGVRVSTEIHYVGPNGIVSDFSFQGDPGLIYLNARWNDAARQFLSWGFVGIFKSTDFLLFIFCLTLPLRRYREILPAAVGFTCTLSITLLGSACGFALDPIWFHPLIEVLGAVAIFLAAFANIAGHVTYRGRARLALAAGAVFGFSSSFDLAGKVQFAGPHTVISALAFNVGTVVAVGLLFVVLTPLLSFLFSFARTERVELIVVSALVADTAWGWLTERWAHLSRVPFHSLLFSAGALAVVLRCLAVLVLFGGMMWLVDGRLKTLTDVEPSQSEGRTAV